MKALSRHAALLAVSVPMLSFHLSGLAVVATDMEVRAGAITQSYRTATTDPNILSVGGATATLQFRSTSNCLGPACFIDGPAVGAYLTGGGQGDSARANLRYTVTVSGGPDAVPIVFSGAYQTMNPDVPRGAGGTVAAAFIDANVITGPSFTSRYRFRSECFNYPSESQEENPEMNCGSGTFSGSVTMTENSRLQVSMTAIAFRRHEDRVLGPASAYIDPFFQIDPVFASSHPSYVLTLDAGVGNALPVPESSTLMLMAAGLAVLGFRRRSIENKIARYRFARS